MKLKNATIGTRVIAKSVDDCPAYNLDNSKGQAGVIVARGIDMKGMSFNADDFVVRFDNQFNDDLWDCDTNNLVGEVHWALPVEYLKLEEKSK